jgi:hypothetical protein
MPRPLHQRGPSPAAVWAMLLAGCNAIGGIHEGVPFETLDGAQLHDSGTGEQVVEPDAETQPSFDPGVVAVSECRHSHDCGATQWCNPNGYRCDPRESDEALTFVDIAPLFAARGCSVCHSLNHPADHADRAGSGAALLFSEGDDVAYSALIASGVYCGTSTRRICVDDPMSSLLVTETVSGAASANGSLQSVAFSSFSEPSAQKILRWIARGAPRDSDAIPTISVAPPAPTPLLLDDFEDGDAFPADPRFGVWQFFSFNPPGQSVSSRPDGAGDHSNGGIDLQWSVQDVANGVPEYPGAGLRSVVENVYVDLSQYSRIVLSHRYDPATDGCQGVTSYTIEFICSELETSYVASVPVSPNWLATSVPLSTFAEPTYQPATGASLADCLGLVDILQFSVQPPIMDGQCGSGTLSLDNISLR